MGSFAGFLGDAAKGYAQAAQLDTQRQFEAEQSKRSQVVDLLGKLAQDPTAHPETQQAALQMALETLHAPWNKPIKPDFNKLITAGPQQPTQTATTAGPTQAPQHDLTNLIPPGQPMPTPPTSEGRVMPQVAQQAQFTPPPNMGMRYTPEEQAAQAAHAAGAVTAATTREHMAQPVYQRLPGGGYGLIPISEHGEQMAPTIPNAVSPLMMQGRGLRQVNYIDPTTGQPKIGTHNLVTNEVMDQEGNVVPGAVPFEPSLVGTEHTGVTTDPLTGLPTRSSSATTKTLPGSRVVPPGMPMPTPPGSGGATMTPAVVRRGAASAPSSASAPTASSDNTVGGRALPSQAMGIISAQARNYERSGIAPSGKTAPVVQQYMAEHGMVPHTTQQVSDYQKAFDLAMSEDRRYKMMDDLAKKVQADPSPENIGSYDAALLAYHMGMTVGQVKGMRSGKDMVMLHEHARSLPESLRTAAEGWVNGAQLSPEQRQNFVDLAKQSRQSAWQMAVSQARGMGFTRYPQPTAGLPALGVVPGTLTRQALTAISKDHNVSYGEARKQAAAAGYNIDD